MKCKICHEKIDFWRWYAYSSNCKKCVDFYREEQEDDYTAFVKRRNEWLKGKQ